MTRRRPLVRHGAAMAELAILLPLFALILVAGTDAARLFYHYQAITDCARNGALYLCDQDSTSALRRSYGDFKAAALAGSNLSPAIQTNNITSGSGSDGNGAYVSVTINYSVPMVSSYLGFSSINLTRTVTMRVIKTSPYS